MSNSLAAIARPSENRHLTFHCKGLQNDRIDRPLGGRLTRGGVEMAVTIRDVAKAAGVSISTVSRALAAPDKVNEATRIRVQSTADSMGYRPNRAARGLITGRTGNIGLVVPDLENPFFGSVSKGVQSRAREAGYAVFVADTDESPMMEAEAVRSLAKQVDGIVLCSARSTDDAVRRFAGEVPLVLVNRRLDDIPSVTFDNAGGLRAVLRHLVALGHRRIAYAAGPLTSWSNGERARMFATFADDASDLELVELGNFAPYFSGGIEAGDVVIASGVTAVVAFNDLMAVGLVDRLRQRGYSVPDDISVAGIDNVPVATHVWPNLTTIDFPRIAIGRSSVDMLLDIVMGRSEQVLAVPDVPVELVIRQSTGVPPATPRSAVTHHPRTDSITASRH
jgi:LacI family transcriptional regulator